MDVYLISNIIGRILFSYLFVWAICLVISKFNYKVATNKAHTRYGIASVSVLFLVPFLAQMGGSV